MKYHRTGQSGWKWVSIKDGSPLPPTTRVSPTQLSPADVIILSSYDSKLKGYIREAVVVQSVLPAPKSKRELIVTVIYESGQIENIRGWKGSRAFDKRCSEEFMKTVRHRELRLSLKRDLKSIDRKISKVHTRYSSFAEANPSCDALESDIRTLHEHRVALQKLADSIGVSVKEELKKLKRVQKSGKRVIT